MSLATVDRVLNARPGVRAVTIDKVNRAIAELGYVRDTAAANLARRRLYRLLFIMPETTNEFIVALDKEIAAQGARLVLCGDYHSYAQAQRGAAIRHCSRIDEAK